MASPVKSQILEQVVSLLTPLIADGKVRSVERKDSLMALEDKRDAIHVVAGDENRIGEDNHGYLIEFELNIKIALRAFRDREALADELEAEVQTKLEADLQLGSHACALTYDGDRPFLNDAVSPSGGIILLYTVQYRRERAAPGTTY